MAAQAQAVQLHAWCPPAGGFPAASWLPVPDRHRWGCAHFQGLLAAASEPGSEPQVFAAS